MSGYTAVVVSDLHIEPSNANEVLDRLEETCNKLLSAKTSVREDIDTLVVLGDILFETDPETDRQLLSRIADRFDQLPLPVTTVLGNHDVVTLSRQQALSTLGRTEPWSLDHKSEIALLDSSAPRLCDARGELDSPQVEALSSGLQKMDTGIVFVHHPLYPYDITENPWFSEYPEEAFCANRRELDEVLTGDNLAAVINGHLHEFAIVQSSGVPHLSVDAYTKSAVHGRSGAYAIVSRSNDGALTITHVSGTGTTRTLQIASSVN